MHFIELTFGDCNQCYNCFKPLEETANDSLFIFFISMFCLVKMATLRYANVDRRTGCLVYFKQAHFVVTASSYTSLVLLFMFIFEELCFASAVLNRYLVDS